MLDTYKMQEALCKEIDKKAESGIKSTTDLDTVWKLIGSYKDLLKIDMLQEAAENGENQYSHAEGGYSQRGRKRDSMGRYSRAGGGYSGGYDGEANSYGGGSSYGGGYSEGERATVRGGGNSYNYSERGYSRAGEDPHERYMDAKYSYASTKAPEHKQKMLEALKEDMQEMQEKMQEMMRNSNCREERDIIKTYMDGLSKII